MSGRPDSILKGAVRPDLVRDETLVSIFRATAARAPQRRALVHGVHTLVYTELDRATDALAEALSARGVGPGSLVGVWMDRELAQPLAVLAILKAGGAYVPFDPDAPANRVAECMGEAHSRLVLTDAARTPQAAAAGLEPLESTTLEAGPRAPVRAPSPADPAYAIFTSGSTGKPKGVLVSHRNACSWVRGETDMLVLREDDVVFQGFSPAFDMSIEEVWPAYLVGAALVLSGGSVAKQVEELPALLTSSGVTVLHAVPSMLAMIEADLPTIRLLNVGGEACPPALAARWSPGRRMVNTYGPTETTVSATLAELAPGRPVTIGVPLPNLVAYVVDEELKLVPEGVDGELLIGGPGVAIGYLHRPEQTRERFIANPFGAANGDPVLYRTGDRVRLEGGEIVFGGRLDQQVKVRGYRVELTEIEARIAAVEGVSAAAVTTREDAAGTAQIVAFVVPVTGADVKLETLRARLREQLPSYMVPVRMALVQDLPRLTSGKVDRKSLPFSALESDAPRVIQLPPRNDTERAVLSSLETMFPGARPGLDDDFFDDLPGHSLLAAKFVSALRTHGGLAHVSLQQLYQLRTGRKIASAALEAEQAAEHDAGRPASGPVFGPPPGEVPPWRYALCTLGQVLALPVLYTLLGALIAGPYLAYAYIDELHPGFWLAALGAVGVMIVSPPLVLLLGVAAKWLLIGRYRAGDYPLWGWYYYRHWLVSRVLGLIPMRYVANTSLYATYLRCLGGKIGHSVHLGPVEIEAPDLVSIGDYTALGTQVLLDTIEFTATAMRVRRVWIGANVYVGSLAVIGGGCTVRDHAELNDMVQLSPNTVVGEAEIWGGSPARKTGTVANPRLPELQPATAGELWWDRIATTALAMTLPIIAMVPIVPSLYVLNELDKVYPDNDVSYLLWAAPLLATSYVVLFTGTLVVLRWLVLGRVKPGSYSTRSGFYRCKWYVDQLWELSLDVLHPAFATLYLPPIYRLLGAKVGPRAEISTASTLTHDLLEVGEESFVADTVVLADAHVRHDVLTLKETKIGKRSFCGNGSLVPDGTDLPDECLVGVLSLAPDTRTARPEPGTAWFGIPPMLVPRRERVEGFAEDLTFRPSKARVAARLAVEAARILFGPALVLCGIVLLVSEVYDIYTLNGLATAVVTFPLAYAATMGFPALLSVAVLKWALVGRYRAGAYPMWSPYVWLSEAVTALNESLVGPLVAWPLMGTPMYPWVLRLMGAHIGSRTCLWSGDITEFDMVTLGDGAVLNVDCGPQTHLFEDRIMKIGPITIGEDAVIGARSVVLYDSEVGARCSLAPQSLVMKGERLPPDTSWTGSPAQPVLSRRVVRAAVPPPARTATPAPASEPSAMPGGPR